jgi:hypothetical protein
VVRWRSEGEGTGQLHGTIPGPPDRHGAEREGRHHTSLMTGLVGHHHLI